MIRIKLNDIKFGLHENLLNVPYKFIKFIIDLRLIQTSMSAFKRFLFVYLDVIIIDLTNYNLPLMW